MALRVVGAGLCRTGTASLKAALERLLAGRCYHMFELIGREGDTAIWEAAARGEAVDWQGMLGEYAATVDWPACAFWREIHAANPDAVVLLSSRESGSVWWESMASTIVPTLSRPDPTDEPDTARRRAMTKETLRLRFTPDWGEREASIAAYERHNVEVRGAVPRGRLIEWQPGDGWEPICAPLELPIPSEPFPHENTTADFRARMELSG
jgi:hypothetical protein